MAIRAPDGAKSREFSGIAKAAPRESRFQSSCKPYVDIGEPLRRAKYVWILQRLFLRGFFNENFFSIAVLEKNFTFIPSTSDKSPLTQLKDLVCVPLHNDTAVN